MNILHINLADQMRGAAKAAFRLHKAQMKAGQASHMLVGYKKKNRPEIVMLPARETAWQNNFFHFVNRFEERTGLQYLWQPWKKQFLRHPLTRQAEAINLHNIHSGYFSHTILPALSRMAPVVWTLHDLWSITGHCSYPYLHDCERWKSGCGRCPALADYPPLSIDTTALLWRIKARVYQHSDIALVTPSRWMAGLIRHSPLLKKFELHCIPHGLDTKVFKPVPKLAAREQLGLPPAAEIVLFSAFDLFQARKGGVYLFEAMQRLVEEGRKNLLLLTMGSERVEFSGTYKFPVHHLGLLQDEKAMALSYSAADLYAGPSLAEAFGLVYMEAMACATPVLAFDCTAVPEVVRHMETGYLARLKDGEDLLNGLRLLLNDETLREKLGRQCREIVEQEYTLTLQAQRYVELYQHLIDRRRGGFRNNASRNGSISERPAAYVSE
ncbi:MAG: D-inositol-3-phosphate glycosyltransferase [bacterium]|nr:D-inositol-3-phosphate glycosyltransferase [bacterium]